MWVFLVLLLQHPGRPILETFLFNNVFRALNPLLGVAYSRVTVPFLRLNPQETVPFFRLLCLFSGVIHSYVPCFLFGTIR